MGERGVAVVLAAGLGTRMRSSLAKVLHPLLGRPMVHFPVQAAQDAGLDVILVVHHQEDAVRAAFAGQPGVAFARQEAPRGTGDAVRSALEQLPAQGVVVVTCGDAPLLRAETLRALLAAHGDALCTVVTANLPDAGSYGRVVRGPDGHPARIVEAAEATAAERAIGEINTGLYAFDAAFLRALLPGLAPHPPKGELYLTDAVAAAAARGGARAFVHTDVDELMGVNDRLALGAARAVLQARVLAHHALAGVTFESPATTLCEVGVEIAPDAVIEPNVVLRGRTRVGAGARVGAGSVLVDATLAEGAEVLPLSHVEGAEVGPAAHAGPFARLRPGARLERGAKVGNFVEIKATTLGPGAKVPHLSYVGDALVGARANVGAGTITCNYDGFAKHRTEIGAGAFIGSNSALVAPVRVGAGAIVGAGSVITREVPPDAIAVARGEQRVVDGGAARFRARKAPVTGEGR